MNKFLQIASLSSAIVAGACTSSKVDDQMRQDLEAASASTMELAPARGGQQVVSAIEQSGKVQPQVTKSRKATTPARTPPPEVRQSTQAAREPAATVPVNRPAVSPPPPGGYKTMGEVLRNAPFPIKP